MITPATAPTSSATTHQLARLVGASVRVDDLSYELANTPEEHDGWPDTARELRAAEDELQRLQLMFAREVVAAFGASTNESAAALFEAIDETLEAAVAELS